MAVRDTDEVPVLLADLRMFLRAVNAAANSQAAWDLLNQYRGMDTVVKESNLSKALSRARERIEGYITDIEDDEPEEEPNE